MVAIPFPSSSAPGIKPDESAGRLINVFGEVLQPGGRTRLLIRRVPGLTQWGTASGRERVRGFLLSGSTLYTAYNNFIGRYDSGAAYSAIGLFPGTDPVTMAVNQASTPQILASNGSQLWEIQLTLSRKIYDEHIADANSVSHLNQRFLVTLSNGRVYYSDIVSINISELNYFTAESAADNLLKGVVYRQEFYAFGTATIEVFRDNGDGYDRVTVIPKGALSAYAIGGFRNEAQQEFENLIWVGNDKQVYVMDGYTPKVISTSDVARFIQSSTSSTLESSAYVNGEHKIWSLSSDVGTWEYNLTTNQWHERASWLSPRWRACQAIQAFNKWLIGDRISGKIGEISQSVSNEYGSPLVMTIRSGQTAHFPKRIAIHRADFDISMGQTTDHEESPLILIRWSDNGGYTWSDWVYRSLGEIGQFNSRLTVNRCGLTGPKGRIWELAISEDIHCVLQGGEMNPELRLAA